MDNVMFWTWMMLAGIHWMHCQQDALGHGSTCSWMLSCSGMDVGRNRCDCRLMPSRLLLLGMNTLYSYTMDTGLRTGLAPV